MLLTMGLLALGWGNEVSSTGARLAKVDLTFRVTILSGQKLTYEIEDHGQGYRELAAEFVQTGGADAQVQTLRVGLLGSGEVLVALDDHGRLAVACSAGVLAVRPRQQILAAR